MSPQGYVFALTLCKRRRATCEVLFTKTVRGRGDRSKRFVQEEKASARVKENHIDAVEKCVPHTKTSHHCDMRLIHYLPSLPLPARNRAGVGGAT